MPIRLDERLTAVANLVDYGSVADVGCDHGKLGYYLLGTDRASKVVATDISEGSLKKARELSIENGVSELMLTRLGDGLEPVSDGEVDTVVIAGLGGDVISGILARSREEEKRFAYFVLSPNTHSEKVRREIVLQKHEIIFDEVIDCAGKRYTLIKTCEGEESLTELQILFGKYYATSKKFAEIAREELKYKSNLLDKNPDSQELASRVALLKAALCDIKE